jgi:hypothetical protein
MNKMKRYSRNSGHGQRYGGKKIMICLDGLQKQVVCVCVCVCVMQGIKLKALPRQGTLPLSYTCSLVLLDFKG